MKGADLLVTSILYLPSTKITGSIAQFMFMHAAMFDDGAMSEVFCFECLVNFNYRTVVEVISHRNKRHEKKFTCKIQGWRNMRVLQYELLSN